MLYILYIIILYKWHSCINFYVHELNIRILHAQPHPVIVTFTEADYELVDDKHLCTSSPKSTNKLYRDFFPLYLESLYQAHAVTNQTKNKQIKKRTRKRGSRGNLHRMKETKNFKHTWIAELHLENSDEAILRSSTGWLNDKLIDMRCCKNIPNSAVLSATCPWFCCDCIYRILDI